MDPQQGRLRLSQAFGGFGRILGPAVAIGLNMLGADPQIIVALWGVLILVLAFQPLKTRWRPRARPP